MENVIEKATLQFLKGLATHNNKSWFDAHKSDYDKARENFISCNATIIRKMGVFAPEFAHLDPKKTVFRIYRDVRFSKDKRPYKENFGANLGIGKGDTPAGYYLQVMPGNKSFAAAGAYMPEPAALADMRQEIDYNLKEFEAILKQAAMKKMFGGLDEIEVLKKAPKGYDPENPAVPYLKHKSFVVTRNFTDKEVLANDFIKNVVTTFKVAHPFIAFLNRAGK